MNTYTDLLTLYCVCYGDKVPLDKQFNQKSIMAGSFDLDNQRRDELRNQHFVFDDEGSNISNLNYAFGDLTATYWIWKNSKEEFVGTNQYRRFWNESEIDLSELNDKTIYVSKYDSQHIPVSVLDQYRACHGNLGLVILNELFGKDGFQLEKNLFYKLENTRELTSCNMFFAHKDVYDRFCELLFSILFDVYEKGKDRIDELVGYDKRLIAFLSERIITSLIYNRDHYFGDLGVKAITYRQL